MNLLPIEDLHYRCSLLKSEKVIDRVNELIQDLLSPKLVAIGGFPFKEVDGKIFWCDAEASRERLTRVIEEALGLSAVLTYANKGHKSLQELSSICHTGKHYWAMHWINLSIIFPGCGSKTEIAFARDRRFYLSWPILADRYESDLFVATAGIKEWLDFTKHADSPDFDTNTKYAMMCAREIILKFFPYEHRRNFQESV